MLAASASLLNVPIVILDSGDDSPAKQIVSATSASLSHIDGSFADPAKIRELAAKVDILTVEIEHVNADVLSELSLPVHPHPSTIKLIQDKYTQKEHLRQSNCPVSDYLRVDSTKEAVAQACETLGLPLMLKSRTMAYDGRGNFALKSLEQIPDALAFLGSNPLYAEKWVAFEKEIAVMVVRSVSGDVVSYPVVETIQKDNICHFVKAPLRSTDPTVSLRAKAIAEDAVRGLKGAGVFGVELFLMTDGTIFLNEIAPRPHNSGHYTIEACYVSQYENHLRAILDLPLGSTDMKVPSTAMINILGSSTNMSEIEEISAKALQVPGASVHLYGKKANRAGRKMGHITIVAESDAVLYKRASSLIDLPPPKTIHSSPNPLVSIIMGSDSDLPVMTAAAQILSSPDFGIPFELTIVSAHRTPDRLTSFAKSARSRGVRVIIAGAGGAAHLPGMVAAMTSLPVIGVPVRSKTALDGVDSLYSIVQMPRGIPVATVAINNSTNAALLAIRILGTGIPRMLDLMERYLKSSEDQVLKKASKLEEVGWNDYSSS